MTRYEVLTVLIMSLISFGQSAYSPNLNHSNDLDRFVFRISNRYSITLPSAQFSQPMHTQDILLFLQRIDSLDKVGALTQQESYRLKNINTQYRKARSLLYWEKQEWKCENYVNLKLIGTVFPFYREHSEIQLKGIISPMFTGSLGSLSYFSEINIWTEYKSDTLFPMSSYEPFNGNPYNLFGRAKHSSVRSSDMFRGGISYHGNYIDFETAVDYLRQGPTCFFPLTFSGDNSPLTYFRSKMNLSLAQYIHTFGLLRTQRDKPKYFYTHRLEFPLFNNRLWCGFTEVIINGSTAEKAQTDSLHKKYYGEERTWEWVYMIPFVPYAFAEHYVGDRDNAILSFDMSLSYPSFFRWYLEFFLDDFTSPLTLFSDDFGNKWAITLGAQWFGLLFEKDVTFTVEYSRVEPWVYTHFYGGSHRYTHYGESLGSPLGPNSAAFIAHGELALGSFHSIGLFIENLRKNSEQRGGSITHVFQDAKSNAPDSKKKTFLGGSITNTTTLGFEWNITPFAVFTMTAKATIDSEEKVGLHITGGLNF